MTVNTTREVAVHDLAKQLADTEERLRAAVHDARFAGVSWSRLRSLTSEETAGSLRLLGMTDEQAPAAPRKRSPGSRSMGAEPYL